MNTTKDILDKLLDDHFRPHQDYIYNPHATKDFLDAAQTQLYEAVLELLQDDKYLNGNMTNFKVDTRNQLRQELRAAIRELFQQKETK